MSFCARSFSTGPALVLAFSAMLAGCSHGPRISGYDVPGACPPGDCETCDAEACETCEDGTCPDCRSGHSRRERLSRWMARGSGDPVGARQKCKHGKLWPPEPRPTGPKQRWIHRYHAAHYWPWPYIQQDRDYVRSLSAMQVEKGWTDATTLFDFHFDPETHELAHAGRLHLRWIINNSGPMGRPIHVQTADNHATSQIRLNAVQQEVALITGEELAMPIVLRRTTPAGRPAQEVDLIRRAELQTLPEPRISYEALPSGSGGN